jgi:hypothetical protein
MEVWWRLLVTQSDETRVIKMKSHLDGKSPFRVSDDTSRDTSLKTAGEAKAFLTTRAARRGPLVVVHAKRLAHVDYSGTCTDVEKLQIGMCRAHGWRHSLRHELVIVGIRKSHGKYMKWRVSLLSKVSKFGR